MKKSRILIGTGTFVLAIAAMFATKANKKFTGVTVATWGSGRLHNNAFLPLTVVQPAGKSQIHLTLYTSGGAISDGSLITVPGNSPVYFN